MLTIERTTDDYFADNIDRENQTYSSGAADAGWDLGYPWYEPVPYARVYLGKETNADYSRHIVILKARRKNPQNYKPYVVACNGAFEHYEFFEPQDSFATLKEAVAYVEQEKNYTLIAKRQNK